ncbi:hypothetical protein, partial [Paenibacillus taichungensis]|uniref:hypothetical protein n=1 Tax=Paenibacillus taichungensis TaxID=484184 RepID=UPI001C52F54F
MRFRSIRTSERSSQARHHNLHKNSIVNGNESTKLTLIIEKWFRAKQIVTPYLRRPIGKDLSP